MVIIIVLIFAVASSSFSKSNVIQSKDIPRGVVEPCLDHSGRIAEISQKWNHSDIFEVNSPPQARLMKACKSKDQTWTVLCEKGGYSIRTILVKGKLKSPGVWERGMVEKTPKDLTKICE